MKSFPSYTAPWSGAGLRFYRALSTSLHCDEATDSGLSTLIIHRVPEN